MTKPMTTTTQLPPLTYQHLVKLLAGRPTPIAHFHIYYTALATKNETVTRTWKERLLTQPWRPWQKHKLQTQPAIYKLNLPPPQLPGLLTSPRPQTTIFIVHPAFKDAITKQPPKSPGDQL